MQKIKIFFLLLCFSFCELAFASIPVIEPENVVEEPTSEVASVLIILEVWQPEITQYKEIANDPKLSLEEFNFMAIIFSKSGVSLTQIWKWRKMKLDWQTILKKSRLMIEDIVPRSEKKWNEPYLLCYTFWREKGDPKKVFSFTDYSFEKLAEVLTLSKYSGKTIDTVIEEMVKTGSFRELSLKFYKEKTKKARKR